MYLYKYIYIGGLMGYISKKVAAYGQFVLVFSSYFVTKNDVPRKEIFYIRICSKGGKHIFLIFRFDLSPENPKRAN